jgi:hypothetical protein
MTDGNHVISQENQVSAEVRTQLSRLPCSANLFGSNSILYSSIHMLDTLNLSYLNNITVSHVVIYNIIFFTDTWADYTASWTQSLNYTA